MVHPRVMQFARKTEFSYVKKDFFYMRWWDAESLVVLFCGQCMELRSKSS